MLKVVAIGAILYTNAVSVTLAATGSVCLAKVASATDGEKSLDNAAASKAPYDFTVSFDGTKPRLISHNAPELVQGLSLPPRHRVQIRQNGKAITSFVFRFSEHKSDTLCLWFKPLYETWSLTPPGNMPWCRCRPVSGV